MTFASPGGNGCLAGMFTAPSHLFKRVKTIMAVTEIPEIAPIGPVFVYPEYERPA